MQYFRDLRCLIFICMSLCGCATTEDRSAFSNSVHAIHLSRQIKNAYKTKTKINFWDHTPWVRQRNQLRKKASIAPAGEVCSRTIRPNAQSGVADMPAIDKRRQTVQPVAWETHALDGGGITLLDRPDAIPESRRLPTTSVWR